MRIGKDNYMKKLYLKLRSFIYRLLHRLFGWGTPDSYWPEERKDRIEDQSKMFQGMVKVRKAEAEISTDVENVFDGDSIVHIGEPFLEGAGIKYSKCMAIGGDTVGTLLERIPINAGKLKPKRVVFHISGNNFLAGHSLGYILEKFQKVIDLYKQYGVKEIAWVETVPISSEFKEISKRIELFINSVKARGIVEVIKIRENLSDSNGFIKYEYTLPDGIHVNDRAYREVIVPVVKEWFVKRGADLI